MLALSMRGRIERSVAKVLFSLPHGTQVLLSRRPPIRVAGQTMHPEMQLLWATRESVGTAQLRASTPQQARRRLRRDVLRHTPSRLPPVDVNDLTISGGDGPIGARHYAPRELGGPHALLVYFHGGGFVTGDLDTHDAVCRFLCDGACVHVLAVDYRLAPEHPFPAAVDDARAALRWAFANAEKLGADPSRVAVGGDSAGGALSAVVSQLSARDGGQAPSLQLLIYPPLDRTRSWPSHTLFDGYLLSRADMRWYDELYADTRPEVMADPRISPLVAPDLSGLCPAIIVTAGFDPLRDEGEAYAAALQTAGTPAFLKREDGMLHGFVNMVGVSRAAREAVKGIARLLRVRLRDARFD